MAEQNSESPQPVTARPSVRPTAVTPGSKQMLTNTLLIGFVIVLIIAVSYLGYRYFASRAKEASEDEETTEEDTSEADEEEITDEEEESDEESAEEGDETEEEGDEETAEAECPSGWGDHTSTSLGYIICRPIGWWYRYFGSTTLGFDTSAIPEDSEYAGKIIWHTISDTQANAVDDYMWMASPSQTTKTINGRTWTVYTGEGDPAEMMAGKKGRQSYYYKSPRTYMLEYVMETASFNTYLSTYDQVLNTVDLL